MTKTRLIILPILGILAVLFFGWSTISAQTMDRLSQQMDAVSSLPSGTVVQLTLSEEDATAALAEYINTHNEELKEMMRQSFGVALDISDPKITFKPNEVLISIRAGFGFMKITPSARAEVYWANDELHVNVTSIELPIVSVDPSVMNSYIEEPLQSIVDQIEESYTINSFKIEDGYAVVEVTKK